MENNKPVREGDLFEVVRIDGKTFEIRYGYYEDFERASTDPIPIYPALESDRVFGDTGNRIVTFIQSSCEHYKPSADNECDTDCGWCSFFRASHPGNLLGICLNEKNKRDLNAVKEGMPND